VTSAYDCREHFEWTAANVQSQTERDGSATVFGYDALQRQITSTRDGITVSNVFNAAGDLIKTVKMNKALGSAFNRFLCWFA